MKSIFLLPGQMAVSREPAEITTVLGSCVAVALYDTQARIGGLNHFLLPKDPEGNAPNGRYGAFAIPELVRLLEREGGVRKRFQAKIFGGASLSASLQGGFGIGRANLDFTRQILQELGIPVVSEDVAGAAGRRITLETNTFRIVEHVGARRREAA